MWCSILCSLAFGASFQTPERPPAPVVWHPVFWFEPGTDRRLDAGPMDRTISALVEDRDRIPWILIRGQTDTFGTVTANRELSRRMARRVADELVVGGARSDIITLRACGETMLAAATPDETREPLNALVEVLWASRQPLPGPTPPGCEDTPYGPEG